MTRYPLTHPMPATAPAGGHETASRQREADPRWKRRAGLLALAVGFLVPAPGRVDAATAPPFAERVAITLPAEVTIADFGAGASPALHALRFSGARLVPGHVLVISVLVVGHEVDGPDLRFRCRGERGGTGLAGIPSRADWVPVFESDPGARDGLATIEWHLEGTPRELGAGRHRVELRWKIESLPRGAASLPAPSPWPDAPRPGAPPVAAGARGAPPQPLSPPQRTLSSHPRPDRP